MKLLKIGALTLICGATIFAACKKDKDNTTTPTPKTAKENLTDGKWQLESQMVTEVINNQTFNYNQYDSMDACDKDDFMTFGTNGKMYSDEGATKCDPSSAQVDSSTTWTLISDTKMAVTDGSFKDTMDVVISSSSIQVTMKETDSMYSYTSVAKYKNIK